MGSRQHITWKLRLEGFLNPLLGKQRRRGVYPLSKLNFIVPLAFLPLCTLPTVFPFSDPIPLPFRFFRCLAPLLSLSSFGLNRLTVDDDLIAMPLKEDLKIPLGVQENIAAEDAADAGAKVLVSGTTEVARRWEYAGGLGDGWERLERRQRNRCHMTRACDIVDVNCRQLGHAVLIGVEAGMQAYECYC